MIKTKKVPMAWQKVWKVEKSCLPILNEKKAQTNYLLHENSKIKIK